STLLPYTTLFRSVRRAELLRAEVPGEGLPRRATLPDFQSTSGGGISFAALERTASKTPTWLRGEERSPKRRPRYGDLLRHRRRDGRAGGDRRRRAEPGAPRGDVGFRRDQARDFDGGGSVGECGSGGGGGHVHTSRSCRRWRRLARSACRGSGIGCIGRTRGRNRVAAATRYGARSGGGGVGTEAINFRGRHDPPPPGLPDIPPAPPAERQELWRRSR